MAGFSPAIRISGPISPQSGVVKLKRAALL
jgi:hypothetical protein